MFNKYPRLLFLTFLLIANIGLWYFVLTLEPGGELRISFFDIGQGDSVLVESPTGRKLLIDGGPSRKVLEEIGESLPFYDRLIDVVLATHFDRDHVGGLFPVLERYRVGTFIDSGPEDKTDLDEEMMEIVKEKKISRISVRSGAAVDLGGGAKFFVLYPDHDTSREDTNNASIIGVLEYHDRKFVFTGDAPKEIEERLARKYGDNLRAEFLKIGHHGSKTSTSPIFLSVVEPRAAFISAGVDNSYGHPHQEVLDVLEKFKTKIFRTDVDGKILVRLRGEEEKIEKESD